MRRKALWIGIGVVIAAYLGWTTLHLGNSPDSATSGTPSANTPTVVSGMAATPPSPTAKTPAATPSPTPAVAPTLLLNAGRVTRGSVVVASGFGFDPGEKLKLTRKDPFGKSATVASAKADKHGNFSGLLIRVADSWPNGLETVTVEGAGSHRQASAHFDLEGSPPGAKPTTYSGKPMSDVSFSGGGFQPGEEVDVYFDSLASPVLAQFRANQTGVVHVSGVAVPISAPGQHAFLLMGKRSGAPVRIPFSVLAFTPWLALSSYTPQPEQTIGVTGHDFAPGERVAIFLGAVGGQPVAQATANAKGIFQAKSAFTVPYDQRGKVNVIAIGVQSQATASALLTVQPYTPTFTLTRYAGPPGTAFGVKGSGFAKNEQVTIEVGVGQNPLSVQAHTDAKGNLTLAKPIEIPKNTSSGKLKVSAEGAHSQAPVSVTFAVTPLSPWFGPVPAAGPAGTRVSFNGGGFAPDETVRVAIKSDSGSASSTTLTTDDSGAFKRAGSLLIPTTLSGTVSLEATGAQSGAQASATYTIAGGATKR